MVYAPDLVPEDPMASLVRRIEALERRLTEVGSADVLATAGIGAEPGGLIVNGSMRSADFDSDSGWKLDGDTATFNTINLRDGVVGEGALAFIARPGVGHANTGTTPFATSTSASDHATVTLTVPDGYTTAVVVGISFITSFVRNHTCRTVIAGEQGDYVEVGIDNAGGSAHAKIVTGLTGGSTVTVSTRVMANAAGGFCHAMTVAPVTYYR